MFHTIHFGDNVAINDMVASHPIRESAERHLAHKKGVLVASAADLEALTGPELVLIYNRLVPPTLKPVKKFESRPAGAKRVWGLLEYRNEPGVAFVKDPTEASLDGKAKAAPTGSNRAAFDDEFDAKYAARKRVGDIKSATDMYLGAKDRFTRDEAARKLTALKAPIPEPVNEGDTDMAKSTTAAKAPKGTVARGKAPKVPKAPKAPKAPKVAAGERLKFADDMVIKMLVATNPKREGTAAHKAFSAYKDGITVKDAMAAGVGRADLSWDVRHGFIAIK